jgi:peptidyl-prolyl cis-trans isomerase SurA
MRFWFTLLFVGLLCSQQSVDGVVAVVGNRTILKSDLVQQAQYSAAQQGVNPSVSPLLFEEIVLQTLDSMIDQFVLLDFAEKDTSISISPEEVDRVLDQQIDGFIARAGSERAFEEALGMGLREIRGDYRKEVFDMLLGERFQYLMFGGVDVGRAEVVEFYSTFKDSLPSTPPSLLLSIIEVPIEPSSRAVDSTVAVLSGVLTRLKNGEEFSVLAKEFSDDPGSAFVGGDLGFTKRGTLVKEYEEVGFSLRVGETSKPFRSPFGFHIVQLVDKQGEKIHTRHILKRVSPSESDRKNMLDYIGSIRLETNNDPGLFDSLAVEFSSEFKNNSVASVVLNYDELPPSVLEVVRGLDEFDLSDPFLLTDNSFGLVYVYEKKPLGVLTLEHSWEDIKSFAKNKKIADTMQNWLSDARSKVYIKTFDLQ